MQGRISAQISDCAPADRIAEAGEPEAENGQRSRFGNLYIDRIRKRKAGRRDDLYAVEILRTEGQPDEVDTLRQSADTQTTEWSLRAVQPRRFAPSM